MANPENTIIDPELDAIQKAARARIAAEAAVAKAAREREDAEEVTALQESHDLQTGALSAYNQAQYENVGQILSDVQGKMNVAKEKDATAQKRENAFRYISGLGDTLSGIANLVGVTQGASNQQQTYNSHEVVRKAEEARKARNIEIEDLSKRLDELKTRERDLRAAGSLKEAELQASMAKEKAALSKDQRTAAATEKKFYANKSEDAAEEATRNYFKQQELDIEAKKPRRTSTAKPRIIKVVDEDGSMLDFDVSSFKNFDADYQRAFDAAIKDGTSGLEEEEIKAYEKAAKLAGTEGDRALKEFFRTHTPRKTIIKRMGINNPRYQ